MNRMSLIWKGNKIGKRDDRLVFRSVILFSFLVSIGGCLIVKLSAGLRPVSRIAALAVAGAVALAAGYLIFRKKHVRDLINRQRMARMLLENGWYETTLTERSRIKGRRKITYFPALYYWRKDRKIYVTVKISMGRYQDKLLALEEKLETGLACELVDKDIRDVWVRYVFLCGVEKNRINLEEAKAADGRLILMKHIAWEYDRKPHMLVAGDTGSGKTWYLMGIVELLLHTDARLYIIDPKNVDLAYLEHALPEVWHEKEDILSCINRFYEAMQERSAQMKEMPEYRMGMNYADLKLPPYFLIFDEYVAFMEMLGKKEWEEPLALLRKIILMGRQAGFFLILACQRPDAKYLSDGIRDQFGFRVALGKMTSSGYTMMFGSTDKLYPPKNAKGRGYVNAGDGVITEFYSPFVPEGHDFFGTIKALYDARCGEDSSKGREEPDDNEDVWEGIGTETKDAGAAEETLERKAESMETDIKLQKEKRKDTGG